MKVKNGTIKEADAALAELLKVELPISTAYKLAHIGTLWQARLKAIQQRHQVLIEKYAQKNERGRYKLKEGTTNLDLTPEAEVGLTKDYAELMEVEEEMFFEKVKVPAKWDGKTLAVKAEILMPLLDFVEVVDG